MFHIPVPKTSLQNRDFKNKRPFSKNIYIQSTAVLYKSQYNSKGYRMCKFATVNRPYRKEAVIAKVWRGQNISSAEPQHGLT